MAGVPGRERGRGGSAPPPPTPRPRADSAMVPAQGAHVPGSQGPTAQAPTHQNQGQRQGYQGQRPHNGNQNNYRQQPPRQNYRVNYRQSKENQCQANIHNIPASPAIPAANPTTVGMSSVAPIPVATPEQELDPRYNKLICFNCGDPGHFVGNCVKPKLCFICNLLGHPVYSCPEWNKDHPVADYFGSANSGLGFYHIDVPDAKETQWLNFRNCGVVVVKKGVTNLSDLEKNLTLVFCKNKKWPWQIRELDPDSYLVRFPPWKKVEDLIEFPAFDLEADAVTVKIIAWDKEVVAMSELSELWVTVKGIPPKWCAWKNFAQVASVLGILMDIDWPTLFKSFYVSVRMKVVVRDVSKLPVGRVVEMEQKLYLLSFLYEHPTDSSSGDGDTGNMTCELAPLVIDVGEVQFTDHMSWNGEDRADSSMGDDLVSVDNLCSLPDRWNYSRVDDSVWDFDPSSLGFEDCVEKEAVDILEQSASHLAYCSGILQSLDDDGSVEEYGSAQEEDGECLSPTVCDQLSTVKKDLLPFLDQATGQNFSLAPEKSKKSGWGPIIAPRMSTRNHGNQNILDKAKEYQKRKNLEVPSRLKGNSFAVLDNCILGNMASSVRINIGVDEVDRDNIIDDIVSAEIDRNRVFVNNNPELVLPHDDIFHDQSADLSTDFPPLPCACDHRLPDGSQPYNMGVWKTVVSKSSSRKKHNKRHDRCNMEY
ncbi:hypothetical protein ACQ4PT_032274 [Festuca glaucescens]